MTDEHPPTTGKVALVTGATSGIGRAAALALAQYGYQIIVVGREAARGAEVVDELERIGPGGEFLPIDLLNLANIRRLTHDVTERYRRLDVVGTYRRPAVTKTHEHRRRGRGSARPRRHRGTYPRHPPRRRRPLRSSHDCHRPHSTEASLGAPRCPRRLR